MPVAKKRQDSRAVAPPARAKDGKLLPGGPSLNPGGQPEWVRRTKEDLRACVPGAVKRLKSIIESGSDDDAARAAKVIFDFTIPKPATKIDVDADVKQSVSPLAGLSTEQLLEILRRKRAGGG